MNSLFFFFNWSFPGDQRRSYCGLHSHLGCPGHRAGCSRLGLLGGEEEEADRRHVQTQCWRAVWYQLHSSTRCPEDTEGGEAHLNVSVWTNPLQDACERQQWCCGSTPKENHQLVSWHALNVSYKTLLKEKGHDCLDLAGLDRFFWKECFSNSVFFSLLRFRLHLTSSATWFILQRITAIICNHLQNWWFVSDVNDPPLQLRSDDFAATTLLFSPVTDVLSLFVQSKLWFCKEACFFF